LREDQIKGIDIPLKQLVEMVCFCVLLFPRRKKVALPDLGYFQPPDLEKPETRNGKQETLSILAIHAIRN
jgi:hypothetical protein